MLEWLAASVGLVLALLTLGALGWQAFHERDMHPVLEVGVERIMELRSGWLVEIEVHNRTGGTASAVEIEGASRLPGRPAAVSSVTIDHVPARSSRSAGLMFPSDPGAGQLELRVVGYAEP